MKKIKIVIIGNSIGARNRSPEKALNNKNYSQFLEEELLNKYKEHLFEMKNMRYHQTMVEKVYSHIENFITEFAILYSLEGHKEIASGLYLEVKSQLSKYL